MGENSEITAALKGRNKLGFAFIPVDCPAINRKGELCDRWGTPYFFHQLSGEQMEIRSAGPDRKLWTPGDEVLPPSVSEKVARAMTAMGSTASPSVRTFDLGIERMGFAAAGNTALKSRLPPGRRTGRFPQADGCIAQHASVAG